MDSLTGYRLFGPFISLFNSISTFVGYLMPKLSFYKSSSGTIKAIAGEDKVVHTFPKGMS